MRSISSARRGAALVGLVITLLAVAPPTPVAACVPNATPLPGAPQPPPTATLTIPRAAEQAEVVFRGHPIRSEDASYKVIDAPATRTTFAIDTLWKGPAAAQLTILTYSCVGDADPFGAPGLYIIYASRQFGELVPMAGVSRPASASEPEDAVLGPGLPVPTLAPGAPSPIATALPTPVVTPVFVTPVIWTPVAALTSTATTAGSPTVVTMVTLVTAPTTTTSSGGAVETTASGPGTRVGILLLVGVIVVVGGLSMVALARRRTPSR